MSISEKQIFLIFNGKIYLFTIKSKKTAAGYNFPAAILFT